MGTIDLRRDDIGRLQQRQAQDTAETYTESFCYDAPGDITSKSDVGTYACPPAGQPQPHAVSGILMPGLPGFARAAPGLVRLRSPKAPGAGGSQHRHRSTDKPAQPH